MMQVDARGLSCPQPVILVKNALAAKPASCEVLVDNATAKENVSRYARNAGYRIEVKEENDECRIQLSR